MISYTIQAAVQITKLPYNPSKAFKMSKAILSLGQSKAEGGAERGHLAAALQAILIGS